MRVFVFVSDNRVKTLVAKDYQSALKSARMIFGHNRFELVG